MQSKEIKKLNKINNKIFIKLLKKYTNIDEDFIDTFFSKFYIGGDLEFDIDEKDICKYLNIKKKTLRKRLLNIYSNYINYIENIDYVIIKLNDNKVKYYTNYQCFERLAMSSQSEKSDSIRIYFSKIREFITNYQELIFQALSNKDKLKKYSVLESIYFFAVDERYNDIFKIGRTIDIISRLRVYNVGRIKEIDLKYLAMVKNHELIEKCMKLKLKKNQIYKNREIYKVNPEYIKKIIDECYCENVDKKENKQLYNEISTLLGLYSYTKDKINIKPYILISK